MAEEKPAGFVPLQSLRGAPDPQKAIAEIRRIYFRTTARTIEHDLAHAVELVKGLPDEDTRGKVAVFMDGLSQLRSEWARKARGKARRPR